jgi:hypothetical protein
MTVPASTVTASRLGPLNRACQPGTVPAVVASVNGGDEEGSDVSSSMCWGKRDDRSRGVTLGREDSGSAAGGAGHRHVGSCHSEHEQIAGPHNQQIHGATSFADVGAPRSVAPWCHLGLNIFAAQGDSSNRRRRENDSLLRSTSARSLRLGFRAGSRVGERVDGRRRLGSHTWRQDALVVSRTDVPAQSKDCTNQKIRRHPK